MRLFNDPYWQVIVPRMPINTAFVQNIREIRLSERKFYQKITDLYATVFDYDKDAKATRRFFQTVQNKYSDIGI